MKNIPLLWLGVGAVALWYFFMRKKEPQLEIGFGDVRFNTQVENSQMAANLAAQVPAKRRVIR